MSSRRVNPNFGSLRINRTLFLGPLTKFVPKKKETEMKPKKLLLALRLFLAFKH